MICGNELWNDHFKSHTEKQIYHGCAFDVYPGLPPTPYAALVQAGEDSGDKTAIVSQEGREYTYSQFLDLTDRLASHLYTELGIRPGDHVGLLLYNTIEFCTAFFAVNKLGAVTVPLPGKFKQQELLSLMEKAGLQLLICHEDYEKWFAGQEQLSCRLLVSRDKEGCYGFSYAMKEDTPCAPAIVKSDVTAVLMFTSGTTARSKGVCIENYSILHALASYQKVLHLTRQDRTLLAVPIYHITGLLAILGLTVFCQGTVYLQKFFHAAQALEAMRDYNITYFHASPTVFSMLLQEKEQFPALPDMRILACGSSNMAKEKIQKLHQWMPQAQFRTVYGLTETASPATIFPWDAAQSPHIGSSGLPIPGLCIKIADDTGRELPCMETGEILLKGTNLFTRYLDPSIPAYDKGWFHTGDLGYVDQEGYLYISDRKKDMINRGGEKICSFDVENVIYTMEQVEEAAVVGIPDEIYGEVAAAAIVLSPGASLTLEELTDYLKARIAKYKIPAKLLVLDKLPVTPSQKTDKKAIRQLFTTTN